MIDRSATVREYLSGNRPPVPPRDAATVVLLRDGSDPGDRLEVFLLRRAGAMTFAGGMYAYPGGSVDEADTGADCPIRAAAVRETAEECGVVLHADDLVPWARWVTPEFSPKRFDTRFFVAAMPAGQAARVDGVESDDGFWSGARSALARYRADTLPMHTATASVLRDLGGCASTADALAMHRSTTPLMLRACADGAGFRYVIDVDGVPVDENEFIGSST